VEHFGEHCRRTTEQRRLRAECARLELDGWTRPELLAMVGVFMIVGGLVRAFVQPSVGRLAEDISEGTFDHTLVRPADAQLLTLVKAMELWQLVDVLVGLTIPAIAIPSLPDGLGAADVTIFVMLIAVAFLIAHCLWVLVSCTAFWLVRPPFFEAMFYSMMRATQFPIGIYPAWLRVSLTAVVPLGIAVTAPAEAVTSRLTAVTIVGVLLVAVTITALTRWVVRRGVRRYSGASAEAAAGACAFGAPLCAVAACTRAVVMTTESHPRLR